MYRAMLIVFILFLLKCPEARILDYPIHQNTPFFINMYNNTGPNYELVFLPVLLPVQEASVFGDVNEDDYIPYNITAFGRSISLRLYQNDKLLSPSFKVYVNDEDNSNIFDEPIRRCHYLHKGTTSIAAISFCQPRAVHGLVFLEDATLEINPVHDDSIVGELREQLNQADNQDRVPHIIKRSPFQSNEVPFFTESIVANDEINQIDDDNTILQDKYEERAAKSKLTIEVALFFDEPGYKIFAPYLKHDERRVTDMLLAYMNGVQALYHHPSLGRPAELALVRLEIMKKQPPDMQHYDGERSKLLDSFCEYQKRKNPQGDENPDHWDMALYVSGLDFFAYENGRKSGVTMGLATVGGVCLDRYACVIAELGTTNVFGKPYPSAGFTSVYILAHEIGHNLGMHHDSSGNNCPKEGYIMSPSRGTNGETLWSTCSAEIMTKLNHATCLLDKPGPVKPGLNHTKFMDTPGQKYGAKRQCEILLRDRDAVMSPSQKLEDICYNLQCRTPHRSGFYHAGPALEGTDCGRKKWCQGGSCIKMVKPKPVKVIPGGWGPWKPEKCTSGCIEKSRGFHNRHRECDNPKPVNTDEGCEGSSYDTVLCNDNKMCKKRTSAIDHASKRCAEFSKLLPELDPVGAGLQAPHEVARPWMGCAIFCRRVDSGSYYTPRVELNDLHVSPYFPDGTWCHSDKTTNYYCLHHHCLPENFQFSKTSILHEMGEDIPWPQNAHPLPMVPPELKSYLSLSADGKPLQTSLLPNQVKPPREEDWETRDYVELPETLKYDAMVSEDNINTSPLFW